MKILLVLIALFVCLQLAVRFWPLPDTPRFMNGMAPEAYEVATFSGYYTRVSDVSFAQLKDRISATSRVQILQDDHHAVALYRSWFWGFPDVIELWEDNGAAHVSGYSIIGYWDWGSNKKRIQSWLDD